MADPSPDAIDTAEVLAERLEGLGCEYAIGGALALGCWSRPRGTIDVDLTLFLPPQDVARAVSVMQSVGLEFETASCRASLVDQGFARVRLSGRVVDVFLPIADFYAKAEKRRVEAPMRTRAVKIWDAETLCVFKMMFYRRKDLADVEQLLRSQGAALDAEWVDQQVLEIFGKRDPRVGAWREIVADVRGKA